MVPRINAGMLPRTPEDSEKAIVLAGEVVDDLDISEGSDLKIEEWKGYMSESVKSFGFAVSSYPEGFGLKGKVVTFLNTFLENNKDVMDIPNKLDGKVAREEPLQLMVHLLNTFSQYIEQHPRPGKLQLQGRFDEGKLQEVVDYMDEINGKFTLVFRESEKKNDPREKAILLRQGLRFLRFDIEQRIYEDRGIATDKLVHNVYGRSEPLATRSSIAELWRKFTTS